jgi:DNA-binding LacI/PurR family transcriptional regulator
MGSVWGVRTDFGHDAALRELARRGCRTVACLGVADAAWLEDLRARAGRQGLSFAPEHAWTPDRVTFPYGTREEFGAGAVERVWTPCAPPVDAILFNDDTIARGAVLALRRLGACPGRDVQIATAANKGSPVLEGMEDGLILLEIDPAEQTRAAIEMLTVLIAGGRPAERIRTLQPALRTPGIRRETRSRRPAAQVRRRSDAGKAGVP